MKLNSYNASLNEKMSEFDLWVTPSLGDIRDTIQFKDNIGKLKEGLDLLALITDDFSGIDKCSPLYLSSSRSKSGTDRSLNGTWRKSSCI